MKFTKLTEGSFHKVHMMIRSSILFLDGFTSIRYLSAHVGETCIATNANPPGVECASMMSADSSLATETCQSGSCVCPSGSTRVEKTFMGTTNVFCVGRYDIQLLLLCWCFTALRHFSCHFGRGQVTYPYCSSLLGCLPELSVHSFASYWQLPFLNQPKGENGRVIP